MRAIDAVEMKKLEDFAVGLGIPARVLMENAGERVASAAASSVKWLKRAVILCGKGNNGGDGLVAARYLHNSGIKTDIFLLHEPTKISEDSRANLDIIEKMGIRPMIIRTDKELQIFHDSLLKSDIIIDAVYGAGFKGAVQGIEARAIDIVNGSKTEVPNKIPYQVIAVDCPSGVDMSSGEAAEHSVVADFTITFEYYKTGLFKYPASGHAGKIVVVDIGIPRPNPIEKEPIWRQERTIEKQSNEGLNVTDSRTVASIIPGRNVNDHKGSFGKVLIIAGSPGMTGAAVLCGQAALRVGAGVVVIGVPKSLVNTVDSMSIETITWGLPENSDGTLSAKAVDKVLGRIGEFDVIAVGPGMSSNRDVAGFIEGLIMSEKVSLPMIIDADGINSIKDMQIFMRASGKDISITPHPGEMARLLGMTVKDVQENRIRISSEVSVNNGINVLLKGAYSIIASKNGGISVNPTGTPAMASAGAGDVLTGAIAGLVAQGVDSDKALVAGAYIHGMCGNIVAGIKGQRGVIASDLLDPLPFVIESIMKSS